MKLIPFNQQLHTHTRTHARCSLFCACSHSAAALSLSLVRALVVTLTSSCCVFFFGNCIDPFPFQSVITLLLSRSAAAYTAPASLFGNEPSAAHITLCCIQSASASALALWSNSSSSSSSVLFQRCYKSVHVGQSESDRVKSNNNSNAKNP